MDSCGCSVICILCKCSLLWRILRELHQIIISPSSVFLYILSLFHSICITIKYSTVGEAGPLSSQPFPDCKRGFMSNIKSTRCRAPFWHFPSIDALLSPLVHLGCFHHTGGLEVLCRVHDWSVKAEVTHEGFPTTGSVVP